MTKVLADALVPIFTGLLFGYLAGRRGLMDGTKLPLWILILSRLV
jgi:malonate transporter and related proteins